ncbi:integrase core domain-containing protein [Roseovarius sp. D22-M7]
MRLEPNYQEPDTSKKHPAHKIDPYLLKELAITRPNQFWCADITHIRMERGFQDLVAVMDWYSRKHLAWRLLKYEYVCLRAVETGSQAREGIGKWLAWYNAERPHSTHGILPP